MMGIAISAAPDNPPVNLRWGRLRSFFYEELKPTPGRLRATFVRVAGAVLAMWVGLGLGVPEMGAVMALAFFASAVDRDESKKVAFGVPPAVVVIYFALTLFLNVFGTTPLARTIAWIVIIFASLYLLQAAKNGAIFLMAGIFGKVFLELWDAGYPVGLTQELQGWIIADLMLAGVCAFAVSVVFGYPAKDPVAEFREELARRFDLLARLLANPVNLTESEEESARAEALGAADKLLPMLDAAGKKNHAIKMRHRGFAECIRLTALLLHQSVVLQTYSPRAQQVLENTTRWIGNRCMAIAHAVRSGDAIPPAQEAPMTADLPFALTMTSTVNLAEQVLEGKASLPVQQKKASRANGFFRPDAFTNPAYLNNAARTFAAAFACYCLISGAAWSGIGTAVTTCLITSLTTIEEARQKQSLRIGGAVLGGLLGLVVIVFILPQGFGLTGLTIVTAIVTFLGGWIYAGSPKISYAGVQLALCYYLGVFGENKTPTSLVTMRDRVLGILIGNLAMWLFYDRIQPVWTADESRSPFADELLATSHLADTRAAGQDDEKASSSLANARNLFSNAAGQLKAMANTSGFEFNFWTNLKRKKAPQIKHTETALQQLFSLEVVAVENSLLRLPPVEAVAQDLSHSLLYLAVKLRGGSAMRDLPRPPQPDKDVSLDEALLLRIKKGFEDLFRQ